MKSRVKVAVIGAGPGGLCAVKHLLADPEHFEFDAFEKTDRLGGIWNYKEEAGIDENGNESAIYENLITNLPKETMAFPDFPFPHYDGRSYIHHTQVLQYLKDYAKHFDLHKHIKFNKMVVNVKPLKSSEGKVQWSVTYSDVLTKEKGTKVYDAVVVCNGRNSIPYIPKIPGLEDFQGLVMHSQAYRRNTSFKDKRVVILGAGPSGEDIGFEIAKVAKQVIFSHNSIPKTCPLPENMLQLPGVAHVDKSSVTLINGQTYECDTILLCTGYLVDDKFLDPSCNLQITHDQRVTPLFLHTFHIDYPTLALFSNGRFLLPFLIYEQLVKLFLKFLKGDITLPSPEKMREEEEKDFRLLLESGFKSSHAHLLLNERLWDFDAEVCKVGQIDRIPNSIRNLINRVMEEREKNLMNFKEKKYSLIGSEGFEQID